MNKHRIHYIFLLLVAVIGILVHTALWNTYKKIEKKEDIYYTFVEGNRLINGVNPYERVLFGDMRHNDKYATYFPLFYVLSGCSEMQYWYLLPNFSNLPCQRAALVGNFRGIILAV